MSELKVHLDEDDICTAIAEYIKRKYDVKVAGVGVELDVFDDNHNTKTVHASVEVEPTKQTDVVGMKQARRDKVTMTEAEMLAELDCRDMYVKEGSDIVGTLIPDGRVRICHRSTNHFVSEGATLEEAYEEIAGLAYLMGTER